MVNGTNGTNRENPAMDLTNDKASEERSGEPSTAPSKSQRIADRAIGSPSQDHERGALIPALRVIISSAERTIGPPLGKNKHLAGTLRQFHALLGKLTRMSDAEFIKALETLASGQEPPHSANQVEVDPRPLRDLSLEEVQRMISDPKTTKQRLLAIVRERFGASTGTLAKLRHETLVERVAALAMNEQSHETVARMASGPANQQSSGTTNAPRGESEGSHSLGAEH
jgi:hypothetical protein